VKFCKLIFNHFQFLQLIAAHGDSRIKKSQLILPVGSCLTSLLIHVIFKKLQRDHGYIHHMLWEQVVFNWPGFAAFGPLKFRYLR
jgi:hypothetical protein